jgi:hypothetical protein
VPTLAIEEKALARPPLTVSLPPMLQKNADFLVFASGSEAWRGGFHQGCQPMLSRVQDHVSSSLSPAVA